MRKSSINHDEKLERYVRPVKELWEMWGPRVKMGIYPFTYASYDDMEQVMTSLTSYDHDKWVAAFTSLAKPTHPIFASRISFAQSIVPTATTPVSCW